MKTLKLFSDTFNVIERGLDYSSLKQKAISHNIANVDTPNYKTIDVKFKDYLESSINHSLIGQRTDTRHFEISGKSMFDTNLVAKDTFQYNHNGNGVDMDKEMADMATNQIYFQSLTEQLNHQFRNLQTVIKGGK
ncbi:flagellar basal body rod protein FlgB [Bacillus spongiae]|uniref:Flagellar basal body rod protein FlgB n=1 Tax=Bacillus spongiae TaxID=2683610 RepID=A0ABU8HA46_9BACI